LSVFRAAQRLPDAAEIDQDGTALGSQPPSHFVVRGSQFQFVALLGQRG